MNEKEITINGKQYPVKFDMQAMMNFEEITGESFFNSKFESLKSRIALIISAAIAADSQSKITVEELKGEGDIKAIMAIVTAYKTVSELMADFFTVPAIEQQNEPEPSDGEGAKN